MTIRIGLMQGRLLPPLRHPIQEFPAERWPDEFPLAASLGFDNIEFIFGGDAIERHPLLEDGCASIAARVAASGVAAGSGCADYFMQPAFHPGGHGEVRSRVDLLRRLVRHVAHLGVTDIVIPCVDAASLKSAADQDRLMAALTEIVPACAEASVRLALELDLPPGATRHLLERCQSPWIRVNYDVGNSVAMGFDPAEEWAAYGTHISSVHVKDRLHGGGTVPLGSGDVDFEQFFHVTSTHGYEGLFTIQGARGTDHVQTAGRYHTFVRALTDRYYGASAHRSRAA